MKDLISHIKIYIAYTISVFSKKYKKYWLIEERGFDARDNGYWFYKYMIEKHPEQRVIYSISADSEDLEKIKELNGEYVVRNSIRHGIIYFTCEALLSPYGGFGRPQWRGFTRLPQIKCFSFLKPHGKRVFLQHGITKDYVDIYTKPETEAVLFICGAKPEYEFVKEKFGYNDNEVKYTGFARYDSLERKKDLAENMILIMPTWRKYILEQWPAEKFEQTDYYKRYNSLLNNKKLINYIEQNDIKVIFYPHILFQQWTSCFNTSSKNIKIASAHEEDVQDLLIRCKMLVTDYSSVFFDVAYMRKKILYYHFDYEKYRTGNLKEGYYDYKEGLGEVYHTENELVEGIISEYGTKLAEKYENRIAKYFVYQDQHNCDRIYSEIIKVVK